MILHRTPDIRGPVSAITGSRAKLPGSIALAVPIR
jgi:hypothetical protein